MSNIPPHEDHRDEPDYAEKHGQDPKKFELRKQQLKKKQPTLSTP